MPNEPLSRQVRRLKGKRIVDFKLNAFHENIESGYSQWVYDPIILLDDGTMIAFGVQETGMGEYGIQPIIVWSRDGEQS